MTEYYNPGLLAGGACRAIAKAPSLDELCQRSGIKLAPRAEYRPVDVTSVDPAYRQRVSEIGRALIDDIGLVKRFNVCFFEGGDLDGFYRTDIERTVHVKTGLSERELARVLAHEVYHLDDIVNCDLDPVADRQKLEERAARYADRFITKYFGR
ncbi:MAG: hypothetical protein HYX94_01035 [Chloroflexi bacterium]|nr:hypothetical protein [Chloroflexota bacterium]